MTKDEKISKVTQDFVLLPEEKQNYVLGILQALVFANDSRTETNCPDSGRKNSDLEVSDEK